MSLFRLATVSLVLGSGALVAIGAAALALTDIGHGEADLTLEWAVVRVAFAVIAAAQLTALYTMIRVRRHTRDGLLPEA